MISVNLVGKKRREHSGLDYMQNKRLQDSRILTDLRSVRAEKKITFV